jgi:DnaJ-class molecular chaperone
MEFKDYYAVLGVPKTATDAEIKRAYRKLAREHHPDLNANDKAAEARFKEINEANEVLGDPEKRRKYDELGAHWRDYETAGPGGGSPFGGAGGQSPFGGAAGSPFGGGTGTPFGGGATYRTMTPDEMAEMFGDGAPFSDFFQTFFGGEPVSDAGTRTRGRAGRARRGQDLEQPIDLTLEEAFTGATRRLLSTRDGREHSVSVRIPAGIADGARVRAAGEGAPGARGGAAGDLYLRVHVLPHARFERRGADLYTHVDVPVTTAVLGGEVAVSTLDGGAPLRLKVPPLTNRGRTLRLRGHGMPVVGRAGERGDLYATVDIVIPSAVTDEERSHYEALKQLSGA